MPGGQKQAARLTIRAIKGATLVEFLAAMAILSFAIIPITVLVRNSIQGTKKAGQLLTAVQLADGIMKNLMEMVDYHDIIEPGGDPDRTEFTLDSTPITSRKDSGIIVCDLSPRTVANITYNFSLDVTVLRPAFQVLETDNRKKKFDRPGEGEYRTIRHVKKLAMTTWWEEQGDRREFTVLCMKPNM